METASTVILLTLACLVVIGISAGIVVAYIDFRRMMKAVVEGMTKLDKRTETVTELSKGLLKACEHLAENAIKFSTSVDRFNANVFNGGKSDAYQAYDETAADRAYRISELERMGLPPDAARAKMGMTEIEEERFTLGG